MGRHNAVDVAAQQQANHVSEITTASEQLRGFLHLTFQAIQDKDLPEALSALRDAAPHLEKLVKRALEQGLINTRLVELAREFGQNNQRLAKERDEALDAAETAYHDGIMHAAECETCASEAQAQLLAEQAFEAEGGIEEVIQREQDRVARIIHEAQDIFSEMYLEMIDGQSIPQPDQSLDSGILDDPAEDS